MAKRRVETAEGEQALTGAQAVSRAIDLLRHIAHFGSEGARLIDLARFSEIPHPTVHRILKMLATQGMLVQDPATSRYRLGPLAFELGLAARYDEVIRKACRPTLERLAATTGDTVYLMVKSGFDGVCVDRTEGSFPIRTVLLEIGGRRPLGAGPASLAILGSLDDAVIERSLAANNALMVELTGFTPARLQQAVAKTRTQGYAVARDWTVQGISGVGVTLPQNLGLPAAISISCISSRMDEERLAYYVQLLRSEAASVT